MYIVCRVQLWILWPHACMNPISQRFTFVQMCNKVCTKLKRGIRTHFCHNVIAMEIRHLELSLMEGELLVLPAFSVARLTLRNGNPGKICVHASEQVAIHAAENADTVKMHTLFVREIKIYAIWLVRDLFTKTSGSTITLLHERQQNGVESGFPFLTSLVCTHISYLWTCGIWVPCMGARPQNFWDVKATKQSLHGQRDYYATCAQEYIQILRQVWAFKPICNQALNVSDRAIILCKQNAWKEGVWCCLISD